MNKLHILAGFAVILAVEGLVNYEAHKTVSTPCGNVTNNYTMYRGLRTWDSVNNKLDITCAQGFTFASSESKGCNSSSRSWALSIELSCDIKDSKPLSCPSLPAKRQKCGKNPKNLCSTDANCTKADEKCCKIGCILKCQKGVTSGLCENKAKKINEVLDGKECNNIDKGSFCSGQFDALSKNCNILIRRQIIFVVRSLKTNNVKVVIASKSFLKFLVSSLDKLDHKELSKLTKAFKNTQERLNFLNSFTLDQLLKITARPMQKGIVKIISDIYGKDLASWPLSVFESRGIILVWVNGGQQKKLAKNPKFGEIIKGLDERTVQQFKDKKKIMRLFLGKVICSKVTKTQIESLNFFVTEISLKCWKSIPIKQICDAKDTLAKATFKNRDIAGPLFKRLVTNGGCGKFDSLTSADIIRYGKLLVGVEKVFIKKLNANQMSFDLAEKFCNQPEEVIPKGLRIAFLRKLKEKKAVKDWVLDDVKKAWHCIDGPSFKEVTSAVMTTLLNDASLNPSDCARRFEALPNNVRDALSEKAKSVLGQDASKWKNLNIGCREAIMGNAISIADAKKNGDPNLLLKIISTRFSKKGLKIAVKKKLFLTLNSVGKANFNKFLSELNCNDIKKNFLKLLSDLALKVDSVDFEEKQKERAAQHIPDGLKTCVFNIYKEKVNEGAEISIVDLKQLGPKLSGGISLKDIKSLKTADDVLAVLASDNLAPRKAKAVVKVLTKLKVKVDSSLICTLGSAVANLVTDDLSKLPIDGDDDGCSWLLELGKADPKSMSKKQVGDIVDLVMKKKKELTEDDVNDMKNLVNGFAAKHVEKIKDEGIPAAVGYLKQCLKNDNECKERAEEFLKRMRKNNNGVFTLEDISVMKTSKLFCQLTLDDIKKIPKETVKDAQEDFVKCVWESKVRVELVAKIDTSTRRRRATDVSKMTSDEILARGTLLTPEEIRTIPFATYLPIAEDIGKIDHQKEVLQAWAQVAANGDVSKIEPSLIAKIGSVCRGFSDSDMGKMDFSTDEAIDGCSQKGLTSGQIENGFKQIIKLKGDVKVSSMNQEVLVSLGYFALGMSVEDLKSIPDGTYEKVYDTFNSMTGWSEDHLVVLKDKLVKIKGPVSSWSESDFTEANVAVGGFNEEEIKSLSEDDIQAIPSTGIQSIPPSKLKYYSEEQLNSLSPSQKTSLSEEQLKNAGDLCKELNNCPKDGSSQLAIGMVTILMAIVTSVTLGN